MDGTTHSFGRLARGAGRLCASRLRCALVSLAFSAALVAVAGSAWVPTGVNDDWALSNGLSGNWPGVQGLCLFLNAALTRAVYGLNCAMPAWNWYFVLEGATVLVSLWLMAYLALSRAKPSVACAFVGAAVILLIPGCTFQSNFTYVAGIASCAGGVALVSSLAGERHSAPLVAAGVALLAVGSLWRWTMFLLCVPFFGIAALWVALGGSGGAGVRSRGLARLWPFAVALLAFAALYAYNAHEWQGDWKDWLEFNDERSVLSDYPHASYDDAAEQLQALGVSRNDYQMMRSWMTEDPDFFTLERLEAVNDVTLRVQMTPGWVIRSAGEYALGFARSPKLDFVVAVALACVGLCLGRRERRLGFALLALAFCFAAALAVLGRLPARVHYPLWAYALGALCASVPRESMGRDADAALDQAAGVRFGRARKAAALIAYAMPAVAVAFVLAVSVPHLRPERVGAIFDAGGFEPRNYLVDYIQEHDDEVFVMNTSTNATLVFAHLMVVPLDEELLGRTVSLGGWAARAPYALKRNELAGMGNAVKGLVDNVAARYVAAGPDTADMLKAYLREHYYPDADYELVDVVEDQASSSKCYVYRFSASSA